MFCFVPSWGIPIEYVCELCLLLVSFVLFCGMVCSGLCSILVIGYFLFYFCLNLWLVLWVVLIRGKIWIWFAFVCGLS